MLHSISVIKNILALLGLGWVVFAVLLFWSWCRRSAMHYNTRKIDWVKTWAEAEKKGKPQ
jgi:predicted permease